MNNKKCKQCGTENPEDFIKKSGKGSWTNICRECNCKNRSESQKGEKNHRFGKSPSLESRKQHSERMKGKNNPMYGKHHSPKTCEILSNKNSGENSPLFGTKRSPEFCKNLSDKMKGENHPMYGKHHTPESKAKTSKSLKGENHPNFGKLLPPVTCKKMSISRTGKSLTLEHCKNMSESCKFTVKEYLEKYPWLELYEEMRDVKIHEMGKSGVQFKCKKCKQWFTPTVSEVSNRIRSIQSGTEGSFLYCSSDCKKGCELFNINTRHFLSILNRPTTEPIQNTSDYQTFRKEVLHRQLIQENIQTNHCEMCNSESNLHVHHEHPVKTHPHLALDPDNGIILCHICHNKIGHSGECSTASLANKICK